MTNILFSTGGNTNTNASTRSAGRSPAGKQIPGGKGIGKTVTAKSVRKPALFVLTKDFLDTIIRILSGVPSLFKEGVLPSRRSRIGEELDELRKFRYVPFNRRIRKRGKAGEKRMKETGKKNAKQTVRRWNRKRKGNKEK